MQVHSRIYLDYNATAPLRSEARHAMLRALDVVGNASSVHGEGRAARQIIEHARGGVAALAGVTPRQVIFTSGGTEANNLALAPGLHRAGQGARATRLAVTAIEHSSVLDGHRFDTAAVDVLPVTADGVVDLAALERLLEVARAAGECTLVSVMLANNETGVIQPVAEVAARVRAAGAFLHVDAVQGAGKLDVRLASLVADLVSLSAHKIGGPQGTGALILAEDLVLGSALLRGGGHEQYRRAGTENVPGIAGFGAAARACAGDIEDMPRLAGLRDRMERAMQMLAPALTIFSRNVPRLANTSNLALPGVNAETALIAFDLEGVAVSSGSACSSGKIKASHVLKAMGIPPILAQGALRISLGRHTGDGDIERLLQVFAPMAEKAVRVA